MDEVAELKRKLAEAEAKAKAPKAEKPTGPVDTGFGASAGDGLGTAQPVIDVATTSVEDTGPAEDADLDLDARVAGLLQR